MESKFAVAFYSDAYKKRIVFTAKNRTPTLEEFARLVEDNEPHLARQAHGKSLVVQLGRLPPTNRPTMRPTLLIS